MSSFEARRTKRLACHCDHPQIASTSNERQDGEEVQMRERESEIDRQIELLFSQEILLKPVRIVFAAAVVVGRRKSHMAIR